MIFYCNKKMSQLYLTDHYPKSASSDEIFLFGTGLMMHGVPWEDVMVLCSIIKLRGPIYAFPYIQEYERTGYLPMTAYEQKHYKQMVRLFEGTEEYTIPTSDLAVTPGYKRPTTGVVAVLHYLIDIPISKETANMLYEKLAEKCHPIVAYLIVEGVITYGPSFGHWAIDMVHSGKAYEVIKSGGKMIKKGGSDVRDMLRGHREARIDELVFGKGIVVDDFPGAEKYRK